MKKKIISLCLVLCLAATAIIGGTLAYFTDADMDTNVMTTGNISITQNENVDLETPIVPADNAKGKELNNKEVTVTNKSNVDVYVRTLVAFEDTKNASDLMHYEYNENYSDFVWGGVHITVDGIAYEVACFVYPEAIGAGDTTERSLIGVWADTKADNAWREIVGDKYNILVLSQATQADGWAAGTTAAQALNTAFAEITTANAATIQGWFENTASDTPNA